VTSALVGDDGSATFSSRETLTTSGAGDKGAQIPISKQIPLNDVRPGRYVLRVEARPLAGGSTEVVRETPITILP